jgi:hypothetical protein
MPTMLAGGKLITAALKGRVNPKSILRYQPNRRWNTNPSSRFLSMCRTLRPGNKQTESQSPLYLIAFI